MMFDATSAFGEVLDNPAGRALLERHLPGIAASPMAAQHRRTALGHVVSLVPALEGRVAQDRLWNALRELGDSAGRRVYAGPVAPDPVYEDESVGRGTARMRVPAAVPRWGILELRIEGPSHGNPFVDVEIEATFSRAGEQVRVGGFYDGDGVYVVRALADIEGEWRFAITSTARSMDGLSGTTVVIAPLAGSHGPVGADGFHFRHADGTRFRPLGTTAYAWTHQPDEMQEQTLRTLAESPFVKLRMCIFPKSYLFNANEPRDFPFPGSLEDGFDLERFDTAHFRRLETRIAQLASLGIEADLILFHAYDRWGFADLGPNVDERYLRYVVRRLGAFANVWWSLANEWDLLVAKSVDDWERIAEVVGEEDPFRHLTGIHNCVEFYDQSRPWITHASVQRIDVYRTAEDTDRWRERWGKPVVFDECGYEGNIDQGWGNISGEELVRRFWEGAVRGGYVGHGETFLHPDDLLWWSKGGELRGSSPARIAFLERILAEVPGGAMDPLDSDWDVPWGGTPDHRIGYFGFTRPSFRHVLLPDGVWTIDVIDTWNMTVEPLPGTVAGHAAVPLPERPFMALRCIRVA